MAELRTRVGRWLIGVSLACSGGERLKAVELTWEYSVQLSATVQSSPPQILLTWPQDVVGTPQSYVVYRKDKQATAWGPPVTLSGSSTQYSDTSVAAGTAYE